MQKHLEVKAQKLNANVSDHSSGFSNALIIPPDNQELLEKHGTLYSVYDFSHVQDVDTLLVTKIVHDVLHDMYFASESSSPIQTLEKAVVEVRDKVVSSILGSSEAGSRDVAFNIIVAALWGNVLYLVQYGKGGSYLMREGVLKPIQATSEGNFTVASGVVKDKDVVLVATQKFTELFPPEKLFGSTVPLSQEQLHSMASGLVLKFVVNTEFSQNEFINIANADENVGPKNRDPHQQSLDKVSLNGNFDSAAKNQPLLKKEKSTNIPGAGLFKKGTKVKSGTSSSMDKKKLIKALLVVGIVAALGISIYLTLQNNSNPEEESGETQGVTVQNPFGNSSLDDARNAFALLSDKQELTAEEILELEALYASLDGIDEAEASELRGQVREKVDAVTLTQRVESTPFYDLSLVNDSAKGQEIKVLSDYVVVSDSESGNLYVSSRDEAKFTVESKTYPGISSLDDYNGELVFNDGATFYVYDVASSSVSESFDGPNLGFTSTYLDFVYSLNGSTITKYTNEGGEYTSSLWGEFAQVQNPASFAINVSIYVLNSSGEIIKLTSGEQDTFAISGLVQPLKEPVKLVTFLDLENIYIADKGNNRIVVLEEDGSFVRQYKSADDDWSDIKDISVSPDGNTLFLLNGTQIFEITLQ